jgi:hypothetical protein
VDGASGGQLLKLLALDAHVVASVVGGEVKVLAMMRIFSSVGEKVCLSHIQLSLSLSISRSANQQTEHLRPSMSDAQIKPTVNMNS